MSQSELNHAVARATGESLSAIKQFGFSQVCLPIPRNRRLRIRGKFARRLRHPLVKLKAA